LFERTARNWQNAASYCDSLSAHLLAIETVEELEYINAVMREFDYGMNEYMYIS
jgi:hypothetical protein